MGEGKHFKVKTKNNKKILIAIVLISAIIISLAIYNGINFNNDKKLNDIRNDNSPIIENAEEKTETETKTKRMELLEELQKENSDIVAWLEIEDTNISYPVLQAADNDYYLRRNYKKEYSKEGSLFLDKAYDWTLPSTNLLIYGHNNIGSSEMFAGLIKYKSESYYNTHKTIRLTTNSEDAEYEIIAVFLSRVYYQSEKDVFRYYYFINAESEEEFNDYVKNSKKASLYNIEATAEYGDQLLTLSTCEYSQEDGRLAVVARKIK